MLKALVSKYIRSPKVGELFGEIDSGHIRQTALKGTSGSMPYFLIAAGYNATKTSHLVVLPEKEEAAYAYNDLQQLISTSQVFFLPSSSQHLTKKDIRKADVLDRNLVFNALAFDRKNIVIVSYPEALMELTSPLSEVRSSAIELTRGEEMDMQLLIDHLNDHHFGRTDFVYQPGEFSWRGGIIDLFSFNAENPIRIEFNGNFIESIREFGVDDQLSKREMQKLRINADWTAQKDENTQTFFEILPDDSITWIKDLPLVIQRMTEMESEAGEVARDERLQLATSGFIVNELQSRNVLYFGNHFPKEDIRELKFEIQVQPSFNKKFEMLADHLSKYERKGYDNIITAIDGNQVNRFFEIFEDIGKDLRINPVISGLQEGFIDHDVRQICYTDHQIFGRYQKFRLRESFASRSDTISLSELRELQAGDFVTHIDHGIGRYSGLEKILVNGKMQEAIRIIYKNNDVLYVSIHSLHRISKYVGKEGREPSLDKLGSNAWKNLKQKTKSRVKELAFDLIKLYARRKSKLGFAFSPDSYLQTELEASFMYEDTEDQVKATSDVKRDMEAPHPMDRLICGDVGFGKTEIAIRAAFKAVCDSKQVAILVPTTILAMQHYKTFTSRLEQFPCKIDYLNRFRSPSDQRKIYRELESGQLDIIIGTHKLLSEKVKFSDLGLLIIDEEQKFGVGSKDKLKLLKVNVDTLTLTATPIPRTLQFSMMGARDLSVINTPPPNRQPIETRLCEFSDGLIKNAIEYEVSRGGQVFFIHNRIQNIAEVGSLVARLCPDFKILIAHGQMKGHELERKMIAFIEGEYDVLISTTIVESGLDIGNANTIIINSANHYGLSDLHQMRGRVGRSNKKAFCYLISPPVSQLTPQARKRLLAIEKFSDLGSGFHIAMRDLDIRGAGNVFGAEQTGFIAEMGFDMYQRILKEAVQELKENEFRDSFASKEIQVFARDCQIETDLEILIPDNYVTHIGERLSIYRELDEIEDHASLKKYVLELTDRFGSIPHQLKSLFEVIELRWRARELGMEKIVLKNEKMVCYFIPNPESPFYKSNEFQVILSYISSHPDRCKMVEKKEKLSLHFNGVTSVPGARDIIFDIIPESVVSGR